MTGLVTAQVGEPLEPEPVDEKNFIKMVVKVAHGFVVVDEQERSFFIDYRNGVLFNLQKKTDVCQQFNIWNSTHGDSFVLGKIDLFGEFKFLKEGGFQEENNQRHSTVKVMYGPRAMGLRGVTSATYEQFGLIFIPGITEYVVDGNYGDFNLFVEAAEYNAAIGMLNPLIFQLDVTHLFSQFSGVPVQKKDKTGATALSFSLEKEEILRELLPQSCSL